ncbi:hypothetical protein PLANTIT3_70031 [Plantibacter sp. T3]|nr:hypothetical protein PLANTIT3_70031 [Plantibacter sp. T3]
MLVLAGLTEVGHERDEQAGVPERVDDLGLADLAGPEASEGLDQPLGRAAVVTGTRVRLEAPTGPGLAGRIGTTHRTLGMPARRTVPVGLGGFVSGPRHPAPRPG